MKRTKGDPSAWTATAEGMARYREARAIAQKNANELGFDYGLECNDLFKTFTTYMLPDRKNRRGFELRCEVVSPENLDKCKPGHGPVCK